jgi:2-polyprenyl-3-methyl-5-hydroxy-6-metoxy-1,4-benzoquinol methylase
VGEASAAALETLDCAVCSNSGHEFVCEKEGARYVRCSACGVVRQHPYPAARELLEFYADYPTRKSAGSGYLSDEGYQALCRDKLLTFADLGIDSGIFAGKRVLDVGCGTGQFLQFVQQFGPGQVIGLDMSAECVEAARARGLDVRGQDFLSMFETCDAISMWHVIEHLLKPRTFIEHAYRLLSPGGSLLIETPVIGPVSDAFGADWRFYMPTEHLNLFPPQTLVAMCRDSGFSLRGSIRFGSGNDSGTTRPANKRAMDYLAKSMGFGDTMAAWFVKSDGEA